MVFNRLFRIVRSYVGDAIDGGGKSEWSKEEWDIYEKYKKDLENEKYDQNNEYDEGDIPPSQKAKEKQYFSFLEMEPTEDMETIKKQYRKLMKKYHPDRFQGDDKQKKVAQRITRQLNEAYDYFERRDEEE